MEHVFIPLMPGTKRPIREATRWQAEDADPDAWAAAAPPDCNWGLRLDGLLVVDCDNPAAHEWWLAQDHPTNWSVKTPHGWHYYYALGDAEPPKAGPLTLDGEHLGIDIKTGRKHYVVVPPSSLTGGGSYLWQ